MTKAKYYYDAKGQRVRKDVYSSGTLSKTTYYVMDNIYERAGGIEGEIQHKEITISGGGRIGVAYKDNSNNLEYNYELTEINKGITAMPIKDKKKILKQVGKPSSYGCMMVVWVDG